MAGLTDLWSIMVAFWNAMTRTLILLTLVAFTWAVYGQSGWKQVEELHFAWAGQRATLILDRPTNYDRGGDFTRLRILMPSHQEFVLLDDDGLENFREGTCKYKKTGFCRARNLIASEHVLALPLSGGEILLVFGWGYASSPGSFHLIALKDDGTPYEVLSLKEFDFDKFVDLESDSDRGLVGKKCFSQEFGDGLLTYDPYSVYLIPKSSSGAARYSPELSKQYNLKHYYGWAGPDCREDVAVVLHPPSGGKPIIMDSKKAEKLSLK
jgi:hypothetical protein